MFQFFVLLLLSFQWLVTALLKPDDCGKTGYASKDNQ